MQYQLNNREQEWIKEAVKRDLTRLQIKKKLYSANYKDEKVEAMLDYYDILMDQLKLGIEKPLTVEEQLKQENEEKQFEKSVKDYFNEELKKEMSWSERRTVKKFLKEINKYSKVMKSTIEGFKKELQWLDHQKIDISEKNKMIEDLKEEIIDRIIDSKSILDISHPITGEEVTKNNLKTLSFDELIELMQDNVEGLDMIANGKITE